MQIETGSFFILVATLAAGGGAGYYAGEKHVFDGPPPKDPAAQPTGLPSAILLTPPAVVLAAPPAAPCEDAVGVPGACPPPGYSADEGGCGALPTKRCNEFKQAMKPKVAERAVSCLNALTPAERCDPIRLNLCGHLALMSACQEPQETGKEAAGATAASLTRVCQTVIDECATAPLGPTLRDCRATLSGMSELGQNRMVSCMKTHCTDKSLLFCEAVELK